MSKKIYSHFLKYTVAKNSPANTCKHKNSFLILYIIELGWSCQRKEKYLIFRIWILYLLTVGSAIQARFSSLRIIQFFHYFDCKNIFLNMNIWTFQVALHPEVTIVACVFLTLLSCIGIVNFSPKSDTLSLWIPETSVSIRNIYSPESSPYFRLWRPNRPDRNNTSQWLAVFLSSP